LLLHSTEDELIPVSHAKTLIKKAKGNVTYIETTGSHNSPRQLVHIQKILGFLSECIEEKPYQEEGTEDIMPSMNCMKSNFSARNHNLRQDTERKNVANQYFKLAQKALIKK
jgi:hypothetical protein